MIVDERKKKRERKKKEKKRRRSSFSPPFPDAQAMSGAVIDRMNSGCSEMLVTFFLVLAASSPNLSATQIRCLQGWRFAVLLLQRPRREGGVLVWPMPSDVWASAKTGHYGYLPSYSKPPSWRVLP